MPAQRPTFYIVVLLDGIRQWAILAVAQFLVGTTLLKGRKGERRGCLCIPDRTEGMPAVPDRTEGMPAAPDRTEGMPAAPDTRLRKSNIIPNLAHRPLKKPGTKRLHRPVIIVIYITIIDVLTIFVSWFCMRFLTNHKYMLIFPAFISWPTSLLVPNKVSEVYLLLIISPKKLTLSAYIRSCMSHSI